MAVVSVTQLGPTGTERDVRGLRDIVTWQVVLDSPTDGAITARDAAGLPLTGAAHSVDTTAKVKRRVPRATDSRLVWNVDVVYETPGRRSSTADAEQEDDPLDESPLVGWDTVPESVAVAEGYLYTAGAEAANKTGITNSASDPFDPPLDGEDHIQQVTIVRNEALATDDTEALNLPGARWHPAKQAAYKNTLNDNAVTIAGYDAAKHCAKLVTYRAERASRGGVDYYEVTYVIQFKSATNATPTWRREIQDEGMRYLDGADKKKIVDDAGEPVDVPHRLDGSGGILADAADTVFREYRTDEEADFDLLGLETVHTD